MELSSQPPQTGRPTAAAARRCRTRRHPTANNGEGRVDASPSPEPLPHQASRRRGARRVRLELGQVSGEVGGEDVEGLFTAGAVKRRCSQHLEVGREDVEGVGGRAVRGDQPNQRGFCVASGVSVLPSGRGLYAAASLITASSVWAPRFLFSHGFLGSRRRACATATGRGGRRGPT